MNPDTINCLNDILGSNEYERIADLVDDVRDAENLIEVSLSVSSVPSEISHLHIRLHASHSTEECCAPKMPNKGQDALLSSLEQSWRYYPVPSELTLAT